MLPAALVSILIKQFAQSSITINKTGLYHFDGSFSMPAEYFPIAAYQPYSIRNFNFTTGANDYHMGIIEDILPAKTNSGNSQWHGVVRTCSFDLYITADSVLKPMLSSNPGAASLNISHYLDFRGYMMSE
jgi:hypothetical protein